MRYDPSSRVESRHHECVQSHTQLLICLLSNVTLGHSVGEHMGRKCASEGLTWTKDPSMNDVQLFLDHSIIVRSARVACNPSVTFCSPPHASRPEPSKAQLSITSGFLQNMHLRSVRRLGSRSGARTCCTATANGNGRPVGVVIVDHGSRAKLSNDMLLEFVQLYRSTTGHPIVEAAHMELAEPTVADAFGGFFHAPRLLLTLMVPAACMQMAFGLRSGWQHGQAMWGFLSLCPSGWSTAGGWATLG